MQLLQTQSTSVGTLNVKLLQVQVFTAKNQTFIFCQKIVDQRNVILNQLKILHIYNS